MQKNYSEVANPFIYDLAQAIGSHGYLVINLKNKKHPLISLLLKSWKADYIVLNWLESVIVYNFGLLQFVFSIMFLLISKCSNKKIIWFYHNKQIHNHQKEPVWKVKCADIAQMLGVHCAYKIVGLTHEVKYFVARKYHYKLFTFNHPIIENRIKQVTDVEWKYSLLIWGEISDYKGVLDFLRFRDSNENLKDLSILVVGSCKNELLKNQIQLFSNEKTKIEFRKIPNDELEDLVCCVKFCLITHHKSSVLSSATLMDSISFGFRIIGPNVGSFKDLSTDCRIDVRTYDDFNEIESQYNKVVRHTTDYVAFIKENSWDEFAKKLTDQVLK